MAKKRKKKPSPKKWVVTYTPWGRKKPLVRRFGTEREARAFYKKLCQRSLPPSTQGIAQEP